MFLIISEIYLFLFRTHVNYYSTSTSIASSGNVAITGVLVSIKSSYPSQTTAFRMVQLDKSIHSINEAIHKRVYISLQR